MKTIQQNKKCKEQRRKQRNYTNNTRVLRDGITVELLKKWGKNNRGLIYILMIKILSTKQICNTRSKAVTLILFK